MEVGVVLTVETCTLDVIGVIDVGVITGRATIGAGRGRDERLVETTEEAVDETVTEVEVTGAGVDEATEVVGFVNWLAFDTVSTTRISTHAFGP